MKLQKTSNFTGDSTHSFEISGRGDKEVKAAKDCGYVELERFAQPNKIRTDGYFCGGCKAWKKAEFTMTEGASTHDGMCTKYNFRDKDFGSCDGWVAKTGIFAYNPA